MGAIYWFFAILLGPAMGIGLAFLLMSILLNKSNNMGDSRSDIKDFSSEIFYLSQQDRMHYNTLEFEHYVESNLETLIKSREYGDYLKKGLKSNPNIMVERYVPGVSEKKEAEVLASPPQRQNAKPAESAWAKARRQNLGDDANKNPWGRDRDWGTKPDDGFTMDEPSMDLSGMAAPGKISNNNGKITAEQSSMNTAWEETSMDNFNESLNNFGQNSASESPLGASPFANSESASAGNFGGATGATESGSGILGGILGGTAAMAGAAESEASSASPFKDLSSTPFGNSSMADASVDALPDFNSNPTPVSSEPDPFSSLEASSPFNHAAASPFGTNTAFGDDSAFADEASFGAAPAEEAPAPRYGNNGPRPVPGIATGDPAPAWTPNPGREEPIYDNPTATRPLWENTNADDDFSDFEEFM